MKKLFFLFCIFLYTANAQAMNIDKQLLNEMLTTLNNEYLHEVDNPQLITNGLQFLHDMDSRFTDSKGPERIYIYHDNKISAIIPFPKDITDISAWTESISSAMTAAGKMSEQIALKDYELPDLFMKKMTESLDKFSHYYSQYNYKEDEQHKSYYNLYSDRMIDEFLYIRVRIFNKQTTARIKDSLQNNPESKAVILDLRGNSGGILNEALTTAGLFIDNAIITYTAARDGTHQHYYTTEENSIFEKPLIILVDGDTASAAEVLAAGLQEQSRAKIIGTRTFGKGTIQNITKMSNGGTLVLTTEQFFTPSGKVIHEHGVEPDICTEHDAEGGCSPQSRLDNEEDITAAQQLLLQ